MLIIDEFNFTSIANSKVLVQLSGGKDSVACLEKMCEHNIQCEAIHFIHDYSYPLPSAEAKRICSEKNIKLHIVDINSEIKNLFLNDFRQRPCRYCKGIMDQITTEFAKHNNFNFICVGDTSDDSMLVNRLCETGEKNLFITKYFNKAVNLPDDIYILRPLIMMGCDDVYAYLKKRGVFVQRVGDTGDKYFEYSREGCPLQFKDFGVPYSLDLMSRLKIYNMHCADFANQRGIRASIHLPSEFIVTIPRGYEAACRNYLISQGCDLKKTYKCNKSQGYHYSICATIGNELLDLSLLDIAIQRFLEREELLKGLSSNLESSPLTYVFEGGKLIVLLDKIMKRVTLDLYSSEPLELEHIKNVLCEILHQGDIEVNVLGEKLNILVFNNNFIGSYGSNQVFYKELCQAIESHGHHLYCANSFAEGEDIIHSVNIDFSIAFGQYKVQKDNINFYDKYSLPHFQWISDNPHKMNIDPNSPYIHYIFIDDEFPFNVRGLCNRPLFLPLGYVKRTTTRTFNNPTKDAILLPAQIRDIESINDEIINSPYRDLIQKFLDEVDYDSSYILQLNEFAKHHFKTGEYPKEFFSLTNSFLRTQKRILVVSSIVGKKVVVAGRRPNFKFPDSCEIEFLGEIEYENIEKLMSEYKYVLNVDPNYHSCFHDRFIRCISAGSVCITNENKKISERTGFSACYRFSELNSFSLLLKKLQDNYDVVRQEQQKFIRGLDWSNSILHIIHHFRESQK